VCVEYVHASYWSDSHVFFPPFLTGDIAKANGPSTIELLAMKETAAEKPELDTFSLVLPRPYRVSLILVLGVCHSALIFFIE
jgi:hypothetical protein